MITPDHAAARAAVLLPDGQVGHLQYVDRRSGRAKVEVGGWHRRVNVADLTLVERPDRDLLDALAVLVHRPGTSPLDFVTRTAMLASTRITELLTPPKENT